ncbi:MAG: hypothetical protein LUQ09_08085 [Methanomassiliicoccales archaeon]|nr:hypothetical protein [Methanomassiliicoccales archaeon]
MTEIVRHLMKLGLSEYEAKTYLATVALGEGTIKQISDESKVPRSRTYDIMDRLAEKGFVEAGNTVPRCYRVNNPTEALDHLLDEIKRSRDEAAKTLEEISRQTERRDNPLWTIKGEWAIDHKVAEMIDLARKDVVIVSEDAKHLMRFTKQIARSAEDKSVTAIAKYGLNELRESVGNARVLEVSDKMIVAPDILKKGDGKRFSRDQDYDVEVMMVCDHHNTIIISREGSGRRAIVSNGTILDFLINRASELIVEDSLKHARTRTV